ncbi:MAG: transcriptional regulator MdrR2 [Rhodospirillales bacterium]
MPDGRGLNGCNQETWQPVIASRQGPRYRAIADAIQGDIAAGRLLSCQRLPTHRDLAWRLGVTVGTVTRAYVEAERRGLIVGEVGRGTFVRRTLVDFVEMSESEKRLRRDEAEALAEPVDLSGNAPPPPPPLAGRIAQALSEVAQDPSFDELLLYRPSQGLKDHARAGADWIANFGPRPDPAHVVPTNGAQQGMLAAIAAAASAGDVLLTENLTYFGVKPVAQTLGLRLEGVEMDEEGILPDALQAAIKSTGARALYLWPTLQNPTCGVLSPERRQAIADICRHHGVTVVEEDGYNFLLETPVAPMSAYLPERTIHIANLSKPLAPALRVGYLAVPPAYLSKVLTGVRASGLMVCSIMHEVGARLIDDGTAMESAGLVRDLARQRQDIVARILSGLSYRSHPTALTVWLQLPKTWRREAFSAACLQRGAIVSSGDVFAIGRQPAPHYVRLSISKPRRTDELEQALYVIRDLLQTEEVMA